MSRLWPPGGGEALFLLASGSMMQHSADANAGASVPRQAVTMCSAACFFSSFSLFAPRCPCLERALPVARCIGRAH